jgi:hypothetical protein
MKTIARLSAGLVLGFLCGHASLATGFDFRPALGTYPGHYSHGYMLWWSDVDQGWDGIWMVRPNIRTGVKFDGPPYAPQPSLGVSLPAPLPVSPEFSQGFFRPAL